MDKNKLLFYFISIFSFITISITQEKIRVILLGIISILGIIGIIINTKEIKINDGGSS